MAYITLTLKAGPNPIHGPIRHPLSECPPSDLLDARCGPHRRLVLAGGALLGAQQTLHLPHRVIGLAVDVVARQQKLLARRDRYRWCSLQCPAGGALVS